MINNANKGKRAEKKVAKQLNATHKAGPNNPDLKKWKDTIEVKNYKKALTKKQLQNAYAQNHANIIVSAKWFTDEALEHAKKNMPRVQLREWLGKKSKLIKRRKRKK